MNVYKIVSSCPVYIIDGEYDWMKTNSLSQSVSDNKLYKISFTFNGCRVAARKGFSLLVVNLLFFLKLAILLFYILTRVLVCSIISHYLVFLSARH